MGKKSSSSLKKKRSKSSSKAKTSSKSKSGKHKFKKVRRREVSLSSSDYDDSKTLDTLGSSSSEDSYSYKSKRDRSRSRKDVKGRKKKVRKRSYSPDSSEDSLHDRKRKKAKRKREYKGREKTRLKKKIRREASVSSASSGSLSCSTCQGGSASSGDGQYEHQRGRSKRKEKGKQRLERGRSGSEKSSRYRTRSRSSCSRSSESSYERIEENCIGEYNSRRLRSVITVVAREVEECREFSRDDTKEEILDDHDYPCRSNDSNDGVTKRELDHHSLPTTEEELRVDAETGDVNADSAWTSESMENKPSETSGVGVNGEDLESILRKKALENLRKFRGGVQSTAKASDRKNKIVSQVKQPISDNSDVVQGKSNVDNAAVGANFDNQISVDETSVPVGRRNLVVCPRNNERLNMDKDISDSSNHHLACAPEKVIDADNPSEKSTSHGTNKPELAAPESCRDPLRSQSSLKQKPVSELPQEKLLVIESSKHRGTSEFSHIASHSNNGSDNDRGLSSAVSKSYSHGPRSGHNNSSKGQDEVNEHSQFELKQASASHESSNPKLLVTQGGVERNSAKTTQPAFQSTSDSGRDVDELSNSATKSCIESSSLVNNSAKLQDESNQGSQFEQKTMNVMRGGEMVQVSYKVYIPKKAPALARRQLKR